MDDLFDNGIDGEPWAESDDQEQADWDEREFSLVHKSDDLQVTAWPTYGNYVIETDTFFMYYYPGAKVIEIHDLRKPRKDMNDLPTHVLTIKNHDLSFFGTRNGNEEWEIGFDIGSKIDQKVQRYISLKAFL